MSRKIVRGWEDVAEISKYRPVIIYGAGNVGRRLLQEIRVNGVENVSVYDAKEEKTSDLTERIELDEIKNRSCTFSFVITVADKVMADEIEERILLLDGSADIYRYIRKDSTFLKSKLEGEGFFNGREKNKALDIAGARRLLEESINRAEPFLCARWGSVEGEAVYAELAKLFTDQQVFSLKNNAGFYPLDAESIHRFTEYAVNAAKEIDILAAGCWCIRIEELYRLFSPNAKLIPSAVLCPVWEDLAWTRALKGKKVLVVHPFANLIKKQYSYREKLFESSDILPEMELKVYQAVQSMNGNPEFESWFAALEKMEDDISRIDFDVALLGCGAYGMPLGAFIKSKLCKKAVHIGGALQLLFGIKGKRWEREEFDYQHKLYNAYWVRPTEELKPQNYKNVEDGCYW